MITDSELLRQFVQGRAEEVFAELVRRHVALVYSTALRSTHGDAHLAEDVAQTVFTDLARKAASLARRESLSGWLYTSAHFAAAKAVRSEIRRREREDKFMSEPNHQPAPDADWEKIRPQLDDVMHELKADDREAILLRYFENRPFAYVGVKLGLSENAARMRVERALEKLRALLRKRGMATSAALAAAISANAVQIAPVHLAATLATTSVAAAETGMTLTLLKIMTATKLKLGVGALLAAGAATVIVVQHQAQDKLTADNESLRQQITQLQTDNESLSNRPVRVAESSSLPADQLKELLRLRGEVGALRRQTNELATIAAKARDLRTRGSYPAADQPPPGPLPDDYPKTPETATQKIFETMARGDWEGFFTNYAEPGVPRSTYDQMFTNANLSNLLSGMKVESIGEATNSFGPNMWFVPYKVQFGDGTEHEFRLHVAQDPSTQRWYFKGGL